MSQGTEFIRFASKNERRYIMRHALGFYNALTLTGLYTLSDAGSFDANNLNNFIPALKHCIATHPILSAAIEGQNTENPSFIRPDYLDLRNHLHLLDTLATSTSSSAKHKDDQELHLITQVTKQIHDQPFLQVNQKPPWKVFIVPLVDESTLVHRVYIIFAYSHSHGDGRSGLEFHRTLLEGLKTAQELYDLEYLYQTSTSAMSLPPPLEEAANLTITWRYLFLNVFGDYIPNALNNLLNLQSPVNKPHAANAWTGKAMSYDKFNFHTGSELLLVKNDQLNAILSMCRQKGVKFTGFFNHLVVHILQSLLPHVGNGNVPTQTLLGQIVVDLRPLLPAYTANENQMINSVTALYVSAPSTSSDWNTAFNLKHDPAFWEDARRTTDQLAECASTLVDQPIGLLRYLGSFRDWFLGKVGMSRDSSYEISNAVVFDPHARSIDLSTTTDPRKWDIERVLFSQPANVTGSPLNFQIVTRRGGDMVITLNWQLGVLGVSDEAVLARKILDKARDLMSEICCGCPASCIHCDR
ncbi:alcohol acetyltransferase [Penicillium nucicola]|uniref:alcohol acetyltransferase n=1 Tax=Penicillium nucicola TaxID=1850975 RepID=UPI0025456E73|nr:alcohol acetyltransferase [Penicillium nucicola]KAJ5757619.1 alcohol acetyltransferase [Penicillium nucicola]